MTTFCDDILVTRDRMEDRDELLIVSESEVCEQLFWPSTYEGLTPSNDVGHC